MTNATVRELNLPDFDKPPSEWTHDQAVAMADTLRLICKHLDLDFDETVPIKTYWNAAVEAIREKRMPDAFYDELLQAADRRRGGRLQ
jgi:hypothetical protein